MINSPTRVLFYADLRASHAVEFLRAIQSFSETVDFVAVCSRTGQILRRDGDITSTGTPRIVRFGTVLQTPLILRTAGQALEHVRAVKSRRGSVILSSEAKNFNPHLVHSLRLFDEGLVTAASKLEVPQVASVWGQEFVQYGRWPAFRLITHDCSDLCPD